MFDVQSEIFSVMYLQLGRVCDTTCLQHDSKEVSSLSGDCEVAASVSVAF